MHEVSCVGRCDQAPVAIVEERYPEARRGAGPAPERPVHERGRALPRLPHVRRRSRARARRLRPEGDGRRRLPDRQEVGDGPRRRTTRSSTSSATPTRPSPGTFKDRQILAEQPHLVIEGMLIAMRAVGAQQAWVFIRHEYEPEEQRAARGARPRPRRRSARRRLDRRLHLAGRLHPRRGDRAARVHGGPPRRAAQQAAVPRRLRPARAARR